MNTSGFMSGVQEARGAFSGLQETVSKGAEALKTGFVVLSGAAVAAGGAIVGGTINAAYAADNLNTLSKQTGISTEELQKFQYASEMIDVPVSTLTGSLKKLTMNMDNARKGTGDAGAAFEQLGVSIQAEDGTLRSNTEVFYELIDALGNVENTTERDALAMDLFGKSAQDLNPLILGGADALQTLGQQAEEAGIILSQDSLDSLNTLSDALDTAKATLSGFGTAFGTVFAEDIAGVINGFTTSVSTISAALSEGGLEGALEALGSIVTDTVLPGITDGVDRVKEKLSGMFDGIEFPEGLSGISEALSGFAESIRPFLEEKFEKASEIFNSIKSALGGLIDSFKNAELPDLSGFAAGAKNLFGAFELADEAKMSVAESVIKGFLDAFKEADIAGVISEIAGGAAELFKAFGIATYDAMEGVVSAVGSFVDAFVNSGALASVIGDIAEGAKNLIGGIMKGSADYISAIGSGIKNFLNAFSESSIPGIIGEIATNAAAFFNTIATVTGDLIAGIGSGIKTFIDGFDNKGAVGLIEEAAQFIGDLFGFFTGSLSGIITSVADAFSGFGDKIAELWNTAGPSLSETGEAFHAFADNVRDAIERFKAVVQPVAEWIASVLAVGIRIAVEGIIRTFGNLWDAAMNVITFLQEGFGAFVDLMHGDVEGAVEGFKAAWENVKEFFANLVEQLLIPFKTLVSVLGEQGSKGVAALKKPFEAAWQWFKEIGANLIEGLKSGISSAWTGLTSWFSDKVSGLIGSVMGWFGEHSPSTVFADIGENLVLGLGVGWNRTFDAFESAVERDVRQLTDTARIGFEDSAIGKSSEAGISSMLAYNEYRGSREPVKINLMLDGDVAATALYDPLRRTAFQRGQSTAGGVSQLA